ncbi:MAG: hypothetical protein ACO20T_03285 [Ilumatobacteraceae bacterium]|jgi:hypothetical protein
MAFGQPQGPPASKRQLDRLLDLVIAAGHDGFRDARGPLGLTQRQANGKFTRDEADELIEQLETGVSGEAVVPLTAEERALRSMSAEAIAAELQRRGWVVMEP